MKNNDLVLLDMIFGLILFPLSLFVRTTRKLLSKIFKFKYQGILIIKFLGAGNLIAIKNSINQKNADILSAKSNAGAIDKFSIGNDIFLIDDSSFLRLMITGIICTCKIIFKNYEQVINLETESKFAKFIITLTSARILSGVSNIHKSYIDFYIYDKYLVNPFMLNKPEIIDLLLNFKKIKNEYLEYSLNEHRKNFLSKNNLSNIKKIVISPTGSNTDSIRRLSVSNGWDTIINYLNSLSGVESIDIVFSSTLDQQYFDFQSLVKKYNLVKIQITSYDQFVEKIKESDLLFTIDSQALHIGQYFKKISIAIYGPSTPFGVNFEDTTYPISQSLICSPCRHKYLRLPCEGKAPCMNFEDNNFEILKFINSVK